MLNKYNNILYYAFFDIHTWAPVGHAGVNVLSRVYTGQLFVREGKVIDLQSFGVREQIGSRIVLNRTLSTCSFCSNGLVLIVARRISRLRSV